MTTSLPVEVSKLRDIGWSLWDPIGLLPQGASWRDEACRAFPDEYDAYLNQAAGLIYKGHSRRSQTKPGQRTATLELGRRITLLKGKKE